METVEGVNRALEAKIDAMPSDLKPVVDEPPPFLGTWPRVYRAVLAVLALVIFLLYLFTKAYQA